MTNLPDLPLLFGHTYYGSGNLPGSVNQGILGILFLNPTLQETQSLCHRCTTADVATIT